MPLTALTLHRSTPESREWDIIPHGASFLDDHRYAFAFRGYGRWMRFGLVPGAQKTRLLSRFLPGEQPPCPPRSLLILAATLIGSGIITPGFERMKGFGGCFFLPGILRVRRSTYLADEEAVTELAGYLSRWFGASEPHVSLTTDLTPTRVRLAA